MSGEPNLIADYETGPISFQGLPVTSNGAEEEKKAFGHSVTVATTTVEGRTTTTVEGHEVDVEGRDPTPVRPSSAFQRSSLLLDTNFSFSLYPGGALDPSTCSGCHAVGGHRCVQAREPSRRTADFNLREQECA